MVHMRKKEEWNSVTETTEPGILDLNMDSVCCDGNLTFSGDSLDILENVAQFF